VARVSILLPVRDAAATLGEAIDSLAAQTYTDFEVLAADDGSTDASPAMLRSWAARDGRIRLLQTGGGGLVATLQAAASGAAGELLARMDADDIAAPTRLERQVALLDARRDLAACGTGVRYFPPEHVRDGARRYARWLNALHEPAALARDIFVECPIAHPTLMVRRTAFERVGGYRDTGWPEDYDLVLRLWEAGGALANVPDVLHAWRETPGRLSRTDPRYALTAFRRCKVHWLRRTLLAGQRPAVVWGAGPVGKRLALELQEAGVHVAAFVELDPRKIGQEIHGAPVVAKGHLPAVLAELRAPLVLGAVGSPGGRAAVRAEAARLGLVEGRDFVAAA
jgi:glycosyltransferase involved in cell wall biosynthesis